MTALKTGNSFFVNPSIKPRFSDVLSVVGQQRQNWNLFFDLLTIDFKLKANFNFHDPDLGWVIEFTRSGKIKVILVPDKDNFQVKVSDFEDRWISFNGPSDFRDLVLLVNQYLKPLPRNRFAALL